MLNKIYKVICSAEYVLASILLCTTVAVIFTQAVLRSLGNPVSWGLEIAVMCFAWATFIAADIAFRNNTTVRVDILDNRLPEKIQEIVKLVTYILVLAFLCMLVYFGIVLCIKSYARSFNALPWLSYSWVTLSLPVGSFLMIITTCRKIYYECIKKTDVPRTDKYSTTPDDIGGGF